MTVLEVAGLPRPTVARRSRNGTRRGLWALLGAVALVALAAPVLPMPDPAAQDLSQALGGPTSGHWLGTDALGRDTFARLVYGARTTFSAAALAVIITVLVGLPFGLLVGYLRGVVDALLSRVADAVMAVPPLILLLAAIAALGPGITLRYVLPNIRAQVVVQVSLLFSYAVLTEASISFLGLGVQAPDASLGVLLKTAIEYLASAPLLTAAPGLLITVFIPSCNLLGDAYTAKEDQR